LGRSFRKTGLLQEDADDPLGTLPVPRRGGSPKGPEREVTRMADVTLHPTRISPDQSVGPMRHRDWTFRSLRQSKAWHAKDSGFLLDPAGIGVQIRPRKDSYA